MRYSQIDQILQLEPGRRIAAARTLRAEEDYLKDHFPRFPVMPGVMMLEALFQAALWMVRCGDDFHSPLVFLKEARSVKFADFLAPGETLELFAETMKDDGVVVSVKAHAQKEGRTTVAARLLLERRPIPRGRYRDGREERVRSAVRAQFDTLFGGCPALADTVTPKEVV
jgi:3-hydroxyacyl-[acyl-carrier-protein] dehydratase